MTGESAELTVDIGFEFVTVRKFNIVHSRIADLCNCSAFILNDSSLLDSYRTSIKTAYVNFGISKKCSSQLKTNYAYVIELK